MNDKLISIDHSEGELPVDGLLQEMGSTGKEDQLSIEDYKEVFEDHKRLVRELDVLLNGENAAQQASLCDIVGQLRKRRNFSLEDMIECWGAAFYDGGSVYHGHANSPNRVDKGKYFKKKFNIDLNKQQ